MALTTLHSSLFTLHFRAILRSAFFIPSRTIGKMTTTIGMHYDVIAGKEQEFESGVKAVIEHLKSVAGHVESHLYSDVQSVGSYLILSQWENQEAFQAFLGSP